MATADHVNDDSGQLNGYSTSQIDKPLEYRPLKIIIVGAGIGGLAAATALRSNGHQVTILERSRLNQELGAGLQLAPNVNGLLRRYGIFAEGFGANLRTDFREYDASGKLVRSVPFPTYQYQHSWLFAHRVRLHQALQEAALDVRGDSPPAELLTSTTVERIDYEDGIVFTQNGTQYRGDLIVGADGVHSVSRGQIPGCNKQAFDSGKSAFRFMLPAAAVKNNPETAKYTQKSGVFNIWYGPDRRIVMYPTNNNEELNFVGIHPSQETNASGDWNNETSVEKMLEVYKTFDPSVRALLKKADPTTLKIWNLLDMEKLPTFVQNRLALTGDAAHPFLPHQGQGAGMAIEDAVSLAVMLPQGTLPHEIPSRLQLYNTARYERAHKIQHFSRLAGQDERDRSERVDAMAFMSYNFCHDEHDYSSQILREYLWSQRPAYWRQPIAFGPMPGPRQNHYGMERQSTESTFTTASIKFKTSKTLLQNLFPPGSCQGKLRKEGFSFTTPGAIVYASFSQTTLNKMEWLGGSGYHHIGLYIHGVQYTKSDGSVIKGAYMPILFESLTDPIVSGRDEVSMPKLYSSIDVHRRAKSYFIKTGWQGAQWGSFKLTGLQEQPVDSGAGNVSGDDADEGIILYRYMPTTGRESKGQACEEYPVYIPFKEERPTPQTKRVWKAEKASFEIDEMDWDALPTLHHIIQRLAEIPVYEIVSARVVEGTGVPDVASARRIE